MQKPTLPALVLLVVSTAVIIWAIVNAPPTLPFLAVDLSRDRSTDQLPSWVPRPHGDFQYRIYEPVRFELVVFEGRILTGTADWISFRPTTIDGKEYVQAILVRYPVESLASVIARVNALAEPWQIDVDGLHSFERNARRERVNDPTRVGSDLRFAAVKRDPAFLVEIVVRSAYGAPPDWYVDLWVSWTDPAAE